MTTTQSEITEERLLADLLDWLKKRSEPDAGLYYQGSAGLGYARVELYGADAEFIADHFHGKGAATLALALEALTRPALRAASITPPAPERSKEEVGVRVKPLEWREVESTTGSHEIYEATSILGYYRVVGCPDGSWFVGGASAERPPNDATDPKQWCMDWAEKYNRTRILSALEPASLHKGEAVAWLNDLTRYDFAYDTMENSDTGAYVWFDEVAAYASPAPLPVTMTDEMVERAGVAIWNTLVGEGVRLTKEDVLNYSDAARAALVAALSRKG